MPGEAAEAGGGEAAAAGADQRGQARVVPAVDMAFCSTSWISLRLDSTT